MAHFWGYIQTRQQKRTRGMNEDSEGPGRVPTFDIQRWIAEIVRRSLLQAGDMRELEDKLKQMSRRSAEITPRAETPDDEDRGVA